MAEIFRSKKKEWFYNAKHKSVRRRIKRQSNKEIRRKVKEYIARESGGEPFDKE
ncbi:MAG: hypothetical protein QXP36_03325 [Conexivisphaerales archaeon]